jgi:hypothetical protein
MQLAFLFHYFMLNNFGCFNLHKDTTPPQPNHNITPTTSNQSNTTHEITQQIIRKLLRMDVLTSEIC